MATSKPKQPLKVEALKHEDATRKNIPTAEFESVMREDEKHPVRVAYERRNRDLDPQLVWRGKDQQDWSDLVVQAPPLYIQEKLHPKVLIDDLRRATQEGKKSADDQVDLFADFNGLPSPEARTEFYQHEAHWANRMILGDSLSVMASLAEREGLRGKEKWLRLFEQLSPSFKWTADGLPKVQSCPGRRASLATNARRGGQLGAHQRSSSYAASFNAGRPAKYASSGVSRSRLE